MEEELIKFLKDNLSIEINQNTEYGPSEEIEVKLYIEGEEISSSTCSLPTQD